MKPNATKPNALKTSFRKTIALSLTFLFMFTLSPLTALAEGNGDGYTAYDLQWLENGEISFTKQGGHRYYRIELYRDGVHVQGSTIGSPVHTTETWDLSRNITEPGNYYFTVTAVGEPPSGNEYGETVQSGIYTYSKATSTLGESSNLRWETAGSEVYAVWDAPSNWSEGDSFEVGISGPAGWAFLYIDVTETRKIIDFGSFATDYMGQPLENKGPYTYDVRAVSGDISRIATSEVTVKSPTSYTYPEGTITAVDGAVPAPQETPAESPQTNAEGNMIPAEETSSQSAPSSWAAESVARAVSGGLVPANLQTNYTQAITRAEFCALAVMAYESLTGEEITERMTFNDTSDTNVEKMGALGVVNGVGDGAFAPNTQLTREQAAVMLASLADSVGKPLSQTEASFADNGAIAGWALSQVGQVQAAGIMSGIGDNAFAPKDPYTREQSIITVLRLYDAVQ